MAPQLFWKGYLKFSLVTCAVQMQPATTEGEKLRFHTLNRRTGHRVTTRWVDAVTGRTVREQDEARGFPKGEDEHVIVEDEELEALELESRRTIEISEFVAADSIGWIWLDRPHFLTPSDAVGAEAFAVIRAAMAQTKTAGISRLVLARRERAVMLVPEGEGIVLWTLRYGDEVRAPEAYFDGLPAAKPAGKTLSLVRSLIRERRQDWDPALLGDPVEERLAELIEARRKGRKRKPKPPPAEPKGQVIDIMEALKRSLAAERKR